MEEKVIFNDKIFVFIYLNIILNKECYVKSLVLICKSETLK